MVSAPGGLCAATPPTVPMVAIPKRRLRSPGISRVPALGTASVSLEGCREAKRFSHTGGRTESESRPLSSLVLMLRGQYRSRVLTLTPG